jgi:hypothetical protein
MDDELRDGQFFYIDRLPAERRLKIEAQLRRGEIFIEQLHTMENGRPIRVPNGAVHHWVGVVFLPRATVPQTLHVIQDYEKYAQVYKPDVRRSKMLESDGDSSKFYLQIYKKSLVTVVLNANFDASSRLLSSTRGESRTYSTRIVEVRNSGERDEQELAEGKDHGYLWRMDGYWKVEQKDGGVYLQFEIVALTGTVSPLIAWLIHDISKSVMVNVLTSTANAVSNRGSFAD